MTTFLTAADAGSIRLHFQTADMCVYVGDDGRHFTRLIDSEEDKKKYFPECEKSGKLIGTIEGAFVIASYDCDEGEDIRPARGWDEKDNFFPGIISGRFDAFVCDHCLFLFKI